MNSEIKELYYLFLIVKQKEFHKSLRGGYTGLGYTFETLIGKIEDRDYQPDFKGIEIKAKLGYSKSPLTLFCLAPKKNNKTCAEEMVLKYGYPSKSNKKIKSFGCSIYGDAPSLVANKYYFKLKIDEKNKCLKLLIVNYNFKILEENIIWSFDDLKQRLYTKLKVLALVKGYPYKINGETYYKYTSIKFYKLKGFYVFLKLIKQGKILVTFNIAQLASEASFGKVHDRGAAFRINVDCIEELFEPLYININKKTTY